MSKPLFGIKIALLVANGFCEQDMTETQRALAEAGANPRIVSPEQGLVNGWTGTAWGHHFAVDSILSTALGADFDMLVIPGGQRSHDKLKLTAHTRRFVSSFMAARKPVAVFDDALNIMIATGNVRGRMFNGPAALEAQLVAEGGEWAAESQCQDDNVISGETNKDNRAAFVRAVIAFFAARPAAELKAA